MKRHALVTVAGAILLIALAIFAVNLAQGAEKPAKKAQPAKSEVVPSRLTDSWDQIEYTIQWNDACKRLLFDGQAICHDTPKGRLINGRAWVSDVRDFVPAPTQPDKYSLHVELILEPRPATDATAAKGRLNFDIQWDEAKGRFRYPKVDMWKSGSSFVSQENLNECYEWWGSRR